MEKLLFEDSYSKILNVEAEDIDHYGENYYFTYIRNNILYLQHSLFENSYQLAFLPTKIKYKVFYLLFRNLKYSL